MYVKYSTVLLSTQMAFMVVMWIQVLYLHYLTSFKNRLVWFSKTKLINHCITTSNAIEGIQVVTAIAHVLRWFITFLCMTWRRMVEQKYKFTHSLTSALGEGEWPASRCARFTPWERVPATHWIGGFMKAEKRINSSSSQESIHDFSIVQPVDGPCTYCAVLANFVVIWHGYSIFNYRCHYIAVKLVILYLFLPVCEYQYFVSISRRMAVCNQ